MDEEASFANLLSSTAAPARPSWDAGQPAEDHDPWANPFASASASNSNPFGYSSVPAPFASTTTALDSPHDEISPYVQRLEQDRDDGVGKLPDPPSVIAARELERSDNNTSFFGGTQGGFSDGYQTKEGEEAGAGVYASSAFATPALASPTIENVDPFTTNPFAPSGNVSFSDPAQTPFVPPPTRHNELSNAQISQPTSPVIPTQTVRKLPSALIDKDLMEASDPEISLKKAFVKSSQSHAPLSNTSASTEAKKYVFTPAPRKTPEPAQKEKEQGSKVPVEQENDSEINANGNSSRPTKSPVKDEKANGHHPEPVAPIASPPPPAQDNATPEASTPTALRSPSSVPLPISAGATPIVSRSTTPAPASVPVKADTSEVAASQLATPSFDRVSVSPLDASSSDAGADYGFKALSIGGSAIQPPPVPSKETWSGEQTSFTSPPGSRFGGKGWGAVDEDDGGLFGPGGPIVKADPWGNDGGNDGGGWGEPGLDATPSSAGPSRYSDTNGSSVVTPGVDSTSPPANGTTSMSASVSSTDSPLTPSRKSKLLSTPLFQISVGDPARAGDAVRGYTVYTVRTKTTSPHYRRGDFSVLRRFSDFLWLFDVLTANNPGVIVPPVPDKHAFGRFQDTFIETRRLALERCLTKITNHPVLQLDPDLRLFLESDSFAIESKNRKLDVPAPAAEKGLLGGWTGPRYIEQDDWFESRRTFLDSLEAQLKGLSKSIEVASKVRLETCSAIHDFSQTITALSESDLGTALSSSLSQLATLSEKEKENNEEQAKEDVCFLLNLTDEYIRFIASVRAAFASRVKVWFSWQAVEKDVTRLKSHREKWRAQGKLGDRAASSLAEINETERRARDLSNEFDQLSKLVKSEFVRFERERVEEFKRILEVYLDGMINRQKELIAGWEELHTAVLGIVQRSQGQGQGQ